MGHTAERRMVIGARTRAALAAVRASGRKTGGTVPYGFREGPGGLLVQHEGEQATMARAVELRAGGLSLRGVLDALTAEGHRNRVGNTFALTQVAAWVAPRRKVSAA